MGRYGGIAVFVPGALPGEKVEARVVEAKSSFLKAELIELVKPSDGRRSPRCSLAEDCGGCSLQHLEYQAQLDFKTGLVREALKRIGGMHGLTVKPALGMEDPWHYRNKAQFHVLAEINPPKVRLGYFLPGSRELLDIEDCLLMPVAWSSMLTGLRTELQELWRRMQPRGMDFPLYHLLFRYSQASGEAALIMVVRSASGPLWRQWTEEFLTRLPGQITQVAENTNPRPGETVLGGRTRILYGPPRLQERIGNLDFWLSPASFYQVNPAQTGVLYRKALEYAELTGRELVFDLYCGVGTISLFLAGMARQVTGVEGVQEAVKDAKDNARLNDITNANFYNADVEDFLRQYINDRKPAPDVVVLDPPRQGVKPGVLDLLAELNPRRIVYVSCSPATLARDLGRLAGSRYEVSEVQPVDMFPQTSHVETVVLITRADK